MPQFPPTAGAKAKAKANLENMSPEMTKAIDAMRMDDFIRINLLIAKRAAGSLRRERYD